MKKLLLLIALLLPIFANAASAPASWYATTTLSSFVLPGDRTGVAQAIKISGVATSTINKLDVVNLNVSSGATMPAAISLSGFTQGSVLFVGPSGTITQNNSGFFFNNTSGNVGIGSTAPEAKLDIVQSGGAAGDLLHFRDSTDGEDLAIRYNGTNGYDFRSETTGIGNHIMTMQTTGRVGIGTTNPAKKLQIDTGSSGSTNGIRLTYNTSTTEGLDLQYTNTGQTSAYMDSLYNSDTAAMYFRMKTASVPVNALTILGSGNVGIGTTSPSTLLNVYSNTVSANPSIKVESGPSASFSLFQLGDNRSGGSNWNIENGRTLGGLGFYVGGASAGTKMLIDATGNVGIGTVSPNSNTKLNVIGGISSEKTAGGYYQEMNYSGNNPYLGFYAPTGYTIGYSTNIGTAPTSGITILNGGNVGIGTTTPATKLVVSKDQNSSTDIFVTNYTSGTGARTRIGALTASGLGTYIQSTSPGYTGVPDWADASILYSDTSSLQLINASTTGSIRFKTGGTSAANERMRITSAGNVGIGTTSPNVALSVNGDIQIEKGAPAYTNYIVCYMNGGKLGHMTQAALLAGAGAAACVAN